MASRCDSRACGLLFLQQPPLDLATAGLGQRLGEVDQAWHLVGGHVLAAPADERRSVDSPAPLGPQHHERLDGLATVRAGLADDAGFEHRRVLVHERLHLAGPDLKARGVDHALQAVDHEEVTVLIDARQITGAQERLAVELYESAVAFLWLIPVAAEHLRPVGRDLTDFPGRQLAAAVWIDHPGIDLIDRYAEALLLGALGRIDVRRADGLSESVAFE